METAPGESRRLRPGASQRAAVLGSLTIEGHPKQVSAGRAFVARTLDASQLKVDIEAATLLTSEIVTNAIQHTKSGVDGGTVTIVVIGVPRGALVEIIDNGSPDVPIVKGDLYAAEGHGLYLVQQLAAQWGYLRDPAGTTVWFHLPNAGGHDLAAVEPYPGTGQRPEPHSGDTERAAHPDVRGALTAVNRHSRASSLHEVFV
jgi:anti-sigma regulatory factor (Ser/Thr protein kinase)